MNVPRAINLSSPEEWQYVRYVFTDIDDTLTTDGRLTANVYAMLERMYSSGLIVIPVTGRPAGWCDMIARFWPVTAVIGENGAFYFRYDRTRRTMIRSFADDPETREENRQRLQDIQSAVLKAAPNAGIASDQAYRESDLAIDFCEDVERLSDDQIDRIVEIFQEAGAVAKVSSIHVNGWFGSHTKSSMTEHLMRIEFNVDIGQPDGNKLCTFVGDSPNDAEMFAAFEKSVGVANLNDLVERCAALPSWITNARSGAGFCEFASHLLSARQNAKL